MPKLLQIAQLGHTILRQQAKEVLDPKQREVAQLIEDMKATVADVNGVGLAAPQVYQSQRIIIVASAPNIRYPNAPKMKPTAFINPKIVQKSKETEMDWEGCLSIPNIRAKVYRSKDIELEYLDQQGKKQQQTFTGFIARIIQHECDHLDGLFFLDRLESNKDIYSEKEYVNLPHL